MAPPPRPLVFQPAATGGLARGIRQIVAAVRPTLGPLPRRVAIQRPFAGSAPELLDDAGTIARRIVELPDRDEDMGAMLLRGILWRLREEVGDGTATAAVLFGAVFDGGARSLAAGGDATRLRQHLERGARVIAGELAGMASRVSGQEALTRLAAAICHDPPLAALLGEIFDLIGEWGQLDIQQGRGRGLEREYVEGLSWEGGVLARRMIADERAGETRLGPSAILIGDLAIDDPRELVPLLELAVAEESSSLLIVANRLSEGALALLLAQDPARLRVVAVRTPGLGEEEQAAALEDLAILTGGRRLLRAAGDTLAAIGPGDLGRARRVRATRGQFEVAGGGGDPRALRRHIAALRAACEGADDRARRDGLRERVGRLLGGAATLWVGGATEAESAARLDLARRTADALRGRSGGRPARRRRRAAGVPPGGAEALARAGDPDERVAWGILLAALEAPFRALLANAGFDAAEALAAVERAGPGHGFDLRAGRVVDPVAAGILDVAAAQGAALHAAVTGAGLALTIDVLIHRREREVAPSP